MTNEAPRTRPQLNGRGVVDTGIDCPLCAAAGNLTVGRYTPKLRRLEDGSDTRLFCLGLHGYVTDEEIVFEAIRTQASPPDDMPDSAIWHAEDNLAREGRIYREDGEWKTR
jgi:hypothetical protein